MTGALASSFVYFSSVDLTTSLDVRHDLTSTILGGLHPARPAQVRGSVQAL